jgi:hypothetical protein
MSEPGLPIKPVSDANPGQVYLFEGASKGHPYPHLLEQETDYRWFSVIVKLKRRRYIPNVSRDEIAKIRSPFAEGENNGLTKISRDFQSYS